MFLQVKPKDLKGIGNSNQIIDRLTRSPKVN